MTDSRMMTATPEELRAAYRAHRESFRNAGKMAQHGLGSMVARGAGHSLDQIELIEWIADKRGISLARPDSPCNGARN